MDFSTSTPQTMEAMEANKQDHEEKWFPVQDSTPSQSNSVPATKKSIH